MAGFHIRMTAPAQQPLAAIEQAVRGAMDAEFLCDASHDFQDGCTRLLVFEKHFLRASGYTSLTLLLTEHSGTQTAEIITAGGGEGMSFTFGANRSFAKECAAALEACGFQNTDPEPEKGIVGKVLDYFLD